MPEKFTEMSNSNDVVKIPAEKRMDETDKHEIKSFPIMIEELKTLESFQKTRKMLHITKIVLLLILPFVLVLGLCAFANINSIEFYLYDNYKVL